MLEDDNSRDRDRDRDRASNDSSEKEESSLEPMGDVTTNHSISDSTGEGTAVTDVTALDPISSPTSSSVPAHSEKEKPSFIFRTVIPVLMALLEPPEMNRVER